MEWLIRLHVVPGLLTAATAGFIVTISGVLALDATIILSRAFVDWDSSHIKGEDALWDNDNVWWKARLGALYAGASYLILKGADRLGERIVERMTKSVQDDGDRR